MNWVKESLPKCHRFATLFLVQSLHWYSRGGGGQRGGTGANCTQLSNFVAFLGLKHDPKFTTGTFDQLFYQFTQKWADIPKSFRTPVWNSRACTLTCCCQRIHPKWAPIGSRYYTGQMGDDTLGVFIFLWTYLFMYECMHACISLMV